MVLHVHRISRMYDYRTGICFLIKGIGMYLWVENIHRHHTGTESHISLGVGEKYHYTLRTVYRKELGEHPGVDEYISQADSIHALNNTVGSNGLVPTLFRFRVLSRLHSVSEHDFPVTKETLRAAKTARLEYERIMSTAIVQRGMGPIPPLAFDHTYSPEISHMYTDKEASSTLDALDSINSRKKCQTTWKRTLCTSVVQYRIITPHIHLQTPYVQWTTPDYGNWCFKNLAYRFVTPGQFYLMVQRK